MAGGAIFFLGKGKKDQETAAEETDVQTEAAAAEEEPEEAAAAGTAECPADDSRITFDGFYISNDGTREYATGTYEWISGERDRIALMRSVGN